MERRRYRWLLSLVIVAGVVVACQELPSEPEPVDLSRDRPVAVEDRVATPEETQLFIDVLENDSSLVGATLALQELVSQPAHGTASIEENRVSYVPEVDYNGADSLAYRVSGGILSATARVLISVTPVNDAPVAVNDTVQVDESKALAKILVELDVLANDRDVDGDILRIQRATQPTQGGVEVSSTGDMLSYVPVVDFNGQDRFSYTVTDGNGGLSIADVLISVAPQNDAPRATNDSFTAVEDETLRVDEPGLLANDIDPDGDGLQAVLQREPINGDVTVDPNGSFVYQPDQNFSGTDQFEYVATDGIEVSNSAVAVINIAARNDAPIALEDVYETESGQTLTVPAPGVLANDTDIDGDPLTAALETGSAHGDVVVQENGSFVYTSTAGFAGVDSFLYSASDGAVRTAAKVRIQVGVGNRAPVANPDTFSIKENRLLSVSAPGILGNDTDPDGDPLTSRLATGVSSGTLQLGSDGSFNYTPGLGFAGEDGFTYEASDGLLKATSAVTIIVERSNQAPEAVPDTFVVAANTPLDVPAPGVLDNDLDPEGDALQASLVFSVENGNLELRSDGSLRYEPAPGFFGTDRFGYLAEDGFQSSTAAGVEITVEAASIPPVAVADQYNVTVNDTLRVEAPGLLENDSDADGDSLTVVLESSPDSGQLQLSPDGSMTFIPEIDFEGTVRFTYRAKDAGDVSNLAEVSINVVP